MKETKTQSDINTSIVSRMDLHTVMHHQLTKSIDNFLGVETDLPVHDNGVEGHVKDDSEGAEEPTLTSEVEACKFSLIVKTLNTCPACIQFHQKRDAFKAILPPNVEYVEVVLDHESENTKRMFMFTRGGHIVPSIFLLTSDNWQKCKSGELTNDKLSIDKVAKTIGIRMPLDETGFKTWLSDSMHRLYLYATREFITSEDTMILQDIQFPLVTFGKAEARVQEKPRPRFGKAFYLSSKCANRQCPEKSELEQRSIE